MSPITLLIADHRANIRYRTDGAAARVSPVGPGCPAEHAGLLPLPDGAPHAARYAFVDDAAGHLVLGDAESGDLTVSVAIPGEHLAGTPDGRYLAVTTGLGANHAPWSDLLTVVDVADLFSVRVRVRAGEPGVVLARDHATGESVVTVRHREPGALEAIALRDLLRAGPHCPTVRGDIHTDIGDLGHGDAYDPVTGTVFVATERGLERFVVDGGRIHALPTVAWPVPGRAYHLRFDPHRRVVAGALRGGPADPRAWQDWRNWLFELDVDALATRAIEVDSGLVFRPALVDGGMAATTVGRLAGDRITVWRPDGAATIVTAPLLPMPGAPRPGFPPWDGTADAPAQRRAVASDGNRIAVTAGGTGQVEIWATADLEDEPTRVRCPTALHEGGQLLWIPVPAPRVVDTVGR
ncbi:hypothetical protein G4H71_15520 [Rhodococcus triatomae]|uniref:Uncharacterized protein n=1 Tax=Rhodococcus triatomae TaxID=300028 RepID=A0A1G8J3E8_9NOCA|nr:hypothetical protein [Rhodococcus triatomae]QNG19825.1 hypothetical protein G4H72_14850 [Rhodococcus triatomae]QNG24259.1 hypothetical protein G4H71_15520 [Rhodococcus triatomae]SDI25661.1 hypothetical protein SAMN05444695_10652 [Rhodococcus triatomae]